MKREKTIKKELRQARVFSEEIRKSVVRDIETGKSTVLQASRELGVVTATIYRWLNKYSRYLKSNKRLIVEDQGEAYRTKELEIKLREFEAVIGRKQMEIDYLNKLIEIAEQELGIGIKKNSNTQPLDGSGQKRGDNTDIR